MIADEEGANLRSFNADDYELRSVVFSCGSVVDRINWLLARLLSPPSETVPAHLCDAKWFLDRLHRVTLDEDARYVFASFATEPLYE